MAHTCQLVSESIQMMCLNDVFFGDVNMQWLIPIHSVVISGTHKEEELHN